MRAGRFHVDEMTDPAITRVKGAADRGDLAGLNAGFRSISDPLIFLRAIESASGFDPSKTRELLIPDWATALLGANPDDLMARTIYGDLLVLSAWSIRGSGRAATVKRQAFDRFHSILRDADRVTRQVLQEQRANPVAWTVLCTVSRGLSLSIAEKQSLIAVAMDACPLEPSIGMSHLQGICTKWGGSFELSIEFARWASAHAPEGHPAHMLVASAYVELYLDQPHGPRTAEMRQEVRQALSKSHLDQPDFGNTPVGLLGKNLFAAAAWKGGDIAAAQYMVRMIGVNGTRVTRLPWVYWGQPEAVFLNAHSSLGA